MVNFVVLQANTGFYRNLYGKVCSANLFKVGQLIHGNYQCQHTAPVDTGYANMSFIDSTDDPKAISIDLTLDGIESNVPFKIGVDLCLNTASPRDVCSFYVTVNNDKDGNIEIKNPYELTSADKQLVIEITDKSLFTANGIYYVGIRATGGISFALSQIVVSYLPI